MIEKKFEKNSNLSSDGKERKKFVVISNPSNHPFKFFKFEKNHEAMENRTNSNSKNPTESENITILCIPRISLERTWRKPFRTRLTEGR